MGAGNRQDLGIQSSPRVVAFDTSSIPFSTIMALDYVLFGKCEKLFVHP